MKLLKIKVTGLALFKDEFVFDFFAEQRVSSDNKEMVSNVFGNIYANNAISVVGINASGKTTTLRVVSFVINMLNNESINNIANKDILNDSDKVCIESYFYDKNNGVCKLFTRIEKQANKGLDDERFVIAEEKLWVKEDKKITSKKMLFEFDDTELHIERRGDEEFLKNDVSIIISLNKNAGFHLVDLLQLTNYNWLRLFGMFPHELFEFLDPSIEYIKFDKEREKISLKFYDKKEISISEPKELNDYLSSGTIKGINVFVCAMLVFQESGYLLIDEIENHFNGEIVATLIRFFMDKRVNKNGATIIFSTHYAELLDEFERNDCVYITRNRGGITTEKLSMILKRNDVKKSEAFQSGFLEGTTPMYDAYLGLRNAIINGEIREV